MADRSGNFDVRHQSGFTLIAAFTFFALYLPIAVLVVFAFNGGDSISDWQGLSLHWFYEAARDTRVIDAAIRSFVLAVSAGGIATLTLVQAVELARLGITANALAPNARTRMTDTGAFDMDVAEGAFDEFAPENMAPLVAYLVSEQSKGVTGQVFELKGGNIFLSQGWTDSPNFDKGARFEAGELDPIVRKLIEQREPAKPVYGAG